MDREQTSFAPPEAIMLSDASNLSASAPPLAGQAVLKTPYPKRMRERTFLRFKDGPLRGIRGPKVGSRIAYYGGKAPFRPIGIRQDASADRVSSYRRTFGWLDPVGG